MSEKTLVVDLGWSVARLTYTLGWVKDGEWATWHQWNDTSGTPEVKLTGITLFAPAEEGVAAQSIFINQEGCAALAQALAAPVPEVKEDSE